MFKKFKPDLILLILICFALFLVPLIPASIRNRFHSLNFALIMLTCTFCLARRGKLMMRISFILIIILLAGIIFEFEILYAVFKFLAILFFIFIVGSLINQTAREKEVTPRVILSSINGYLLLGLIISLMVALISHFRPGSYNFGSRDNQFAFSHEPIIDFAYYAFTAMTTVGYGDLLPLSPAAKSLSVFASVSGQLYLTILIAMLVGKFIGSQQSPKN
jgi:hypothetical protein